MNPMPDLTGRVTLITGASRGLGRALALAFASAGARVALCARSESDLAAVAEEIAAARGDVLARTADVSNAEAMRALVSEAERAWGPVEALINNASLLDPRVPLAEVDPTDWRRVLEVNVTGALLASQAVLPGMRTLGRGSIVNVTSGVGDEPRARWGAYAVSKWALEGLTWNMAREEREHGIRVNAVDPGRMRTAMRRRAYPEEDPRTLPEPGEAVDVFLWLASDAAAGVTGRRFDAQDWGE